MSESSNIEVVEYDGEQEISRKSITFESNTTSNQYKYTVKNQIITIQLKSEDPRLLGMNKSITVPPLDYP